MASIPHVKMLFYGYSKKKTKYPETKAYNRDTSGLEILLRIYPPAGSHQQDDS